MKSTPDQIREARATNIARVPQMPGTPMNILTAKWSAIMTQAVSQSLETGVWLCRATDAKAHVSKATTPMSGNLLQSTNSTPGTNRFYPYNRQSGYNFK